VLLEKEITLTKFVWLTLKIECICFSIAILTSFLVDTHRIEIIDVFLTLYIFFILTFFRFIFLNYFFSWYVTKKLFKKNYSLFYIVLINIFIATVILFLLMLALYFKVGEKKFWLGFEQGIHIYIYLAMIVSYIEIVRRINKQLKGS
jgi:hypothetical protein